MKTKENIQIIYEQSGEKWSKFKKLPTEFTDLIKKELKKDSVVLDIGCGGGRLSTELNEYCKKVVGIDYSKNSIKFARKNNPRKNVEYLFMDGENLKFKDGIFDIVVSHAAINKKMCRAEYCFKEAYRVLGKDGKLIIKMIYLNQGSPFVKDLGYSSLEVKKILKKEGFEKIKIKVIKQSIPLDENTLNFFKRTELGLFIKKSDIEKVKSGKIKKMDDSFMVVYAKKKIK